MKKTFHKDYLLNELYLPNDSIKDIITGTRRWSIVHEIIFKDKDNKVYRTHYSEGATESQDESPWEYDENVECTEVELKEVVRLEWVEKDE